MAANDADRKNANALENVVGCHSGAAGDYAAYDYYPGSCCLRWWHLVKVKRVGQSHKLDFRIQLLVGIERINAKAAVATGDDGDDGEDDGAGGQRETGRQS